MKNLICASAVAMGRRGLIQLLLLGALAPDLLAQTTYYVAATGDDRNDGRSAGSPFRSLDKVNTLSFRPGDQILLRRRDTFRGTLFVRQSGEANAPITIDAYGSGNKPIITGSVPVTNWTNVGNNTWQAICAQCGSQVTGLYRNAAALPLGRYPNLSDANKGYLTVQSHSGKTRLTSRQSLSTNWTGGEAVFRPVQWILNRAIITEQNGNTITLVGSGNYDITDNWGYFIQNHPATLDQTGEWCYTPASKTIRLYDSQRNPNDEQIMATVFAEALNVANASFVRVRNLQLTQALSSGLLITNGSNLIIADTDITQSGEDGLVIRGDGQQVVVENNLIEDANNNGVTISTYQHVTVRGNTIRRIGLTAGRGKSGDGTYVGFQSASTANTLIENNVLDQIGYNGLNFSTSTTVQRNQISNFCLTKSDGSGLYIWNGNRKHMGDIRLLSNIVYNGSGVSEGTSGSGSSGVNGIYLDDCTTNIEVTGNTVYNCQGLGIYLHGSSNIRVTENTAYDNDEGQLAIMSAKGCQPRNNLIQNNNLVSRLPSQFNVKYESDQNDLGNYGQFDHNVYARPFDDTFKILAVYNKTVGAALSLANWQNKYGKDLTSVNSPITYGSGNPDDYIRCIANPTAQPIRVSLEGTYRDLRNKTYSEQTSVAAFSSVILLKQIGTAASSAPVTTLRNPENPANATAGLDYQYYEGSWSSLPNFDALTPAKTAITNTPNLSMRSREDNFAIRYKGYMSVPTDGVYSFYTNSDDGSKLYIGSTEVVNNDGGHGEQERSGSIGLKAGRHALTIVYFEGSGGQALTVSYAGPGIGKQAIPENAFWRATTKQPALDPSMASLTMRDPENPANTMAGLDYQYYEGNWNNLPNFDALTPAKTGVSSIPTLGVRSREDNFAIRYQGYIDVPTNGVYSFCTNSDDGSKLYIGSTEVVNNDGGHGEQERSGSIGLKAGRHALTIVYFEGSGGQTLTVSYAGPGIGKQTIPSVAFRRVSAGDNPTTPVTPGGSTAGMGTGLRAEYFNNRDLNAPVVLSRVDATVNVDWGDRSPADGVSSDNFSVRWTGQVEAPVSGNYVFSTTTDDGVRLWVNGVQLIDDWRGHAPTTNSGPSMALVAGQKYDIRMEYFEGPGGAVARLLWAFPDQPQQPIPQGRLYPAAGGSARLGAELISDGGLVYPVPAYDEFTFVPNDDVQTLRVIDLLGRDQLQFGDIRRGQVLPFGNRLPAGDYLLHILYTNGTHRTQKVLKMGR